MNAEINLDFVSIGCNKVAHCVHWGRNNLVAFGAHNFVSIYNPIEYKLETTLPGHTGRVNSVKWVPNTKAEFTKRVFAEEEELLSGGSDKNILYWIKNKETKQYSVKETLIGHKESVTCIDCISLPDNSLLCASVGADCNLNIWKKEGTEDSKWTLEQTISFGRKMMDCVSLSLLGSKTLIPILAVGGVDSLIHLFIYVNNKFIKLFSLQGHQDWIRSLSFATLNNSDLLLASSSQDCKIRIWRINTLSSDSNLISTFGKETTSSNSSNAVSSKGYIFKVSDIQYSILLESVLSAHEQWVYSVSWQPPLIDKEGNYSQPLSLLSSSMDKSMMIWRPSSQSEGIWIPYVSVGELGGNTLGFYGGQFNPEGTSILANGFNGAFHLWKKSINSENAEEWSADVTISGHFGPVMDLEWDPSRSYLISVSEDQSSRLFSPWKRDSSSTSTWHELGRPQIHGYDLECLSFVGPFRIITGADEKVLRVFDAPQTSISTLNQISLFVTPEHLEARPLGANVPPLGLSNKPVFNENEMNADIKFEDYENPVPAPIVHNLPPVEDYLLQSTLWPEVHKLYGHPNELVSVCTNHKGTLIASACKGTKPDQSSIKIWDAKTWKEVANIVFHTLTVVQLEFSHDDKYLMSVSRDRQMGVFSVTETGEDKDNKPIIELVFKTKNHERIIWSGSWSFDDKYIATGSRDKLVKIWTIINNSWGCALTLPEFTTGVTSVSWGPVSKNKDGNLLYTLAVGLENGEISIWSIDGTSATIIGTVPKMQSHIETVRRLRWNTMLNEENIIKEDKTKYLLATCSTDNSIRLFTINFNFK